MTLGTIQLGVGAAYSITLWLLQFRARPVVTGPATARLLRQVGLAHAVGQATTMMSLSAGAVSFTHIVKSLEPFFSAVVSALVLQQTKNAAVYATLIPVVGGVAYACLQERAFSWLAFTTAMLSNLAFSLRAVLSKLAMSSSTTAAVGANMTAPNVFGLVTIAAFVISIPMAAVGEGRSMKKVWQRALQIQPQKGELCQAVLLSGLFHYLNNEVMYLALGKVHPITLAVGNTMKRVFILMAAVIFLDNQISPQAAIGSGIAIAGVLLYSLATEHYEKKVLVNDMKKRK
jgi:solute carrier family 35, member E1